MIKITTPLMPPSGVFEAYCAEIIDSQQLTNGGPFHIRYEQALASYLSAEHLSLVANGTLALTLALEMAIKHPGEVITTPYSFVATAAAIRQAGCIPVFVDIDPVSKNLSPELVAEAITPQTVAIMPVHVHGVPCDVDAFSEISAASGIPVIYDAAHAFGVSLRGESLLSFGALSVLSLHATKVASSVEGGAIICKLEEEKNQLDNLHNFGIEQDGQVRRFGCNAKMSELHAAFGLAVLPLVNRAIDHRKKLALTYMEMLAGVQGLSTTVMKNFDEWNGSYMPLYVDPAVYGCTSDDLQGILFSAGVSSRKYFAPLINELDAYSEYGNSASYPNARKASSQVLCLPLHHELSGENIERICHTILKKSN